VNDPDTIREIFASLQTQIDSLLKLHVRMVVITAFVGALIAEHPNKEVLRTAFGEFWKDLGGPQLGSKLSIENIDALREELSGLAEAAFPGRNADAINDDCAGIGDFLRGAAKQAANAPVCTHVERFGDSAA